VVRVKIARVRTVRAVAVVRRAVVKMLARMGRHNPP
jgi:hypothetical protein